MRKIDLKCKSGYSKILVGESIKNLLNYIPVDKSIVISDSNVIKYYRSLFPVDKIIEINPGEKSKNIKTILFIIEKFIDFGVDRNFFIVGIGGGIVCDITGFISSIYSRGLKFGFVPTTLLAQSDASIGGKNGVNFKNFKNIIGTIRQPEFILSDLTLLKSLPKKEISYGFAEIIKTALIADNELFDILENQKENIFSEDFFEKIIYMTAKIKSGIVQQDEFETNLRRILNFGHTIGHAIESVYKLPHGKAVSLGMAKALDISIIKKRLNIDCSTRIKNVLKKYNLPVDYSIDKTKIIDAIMKDKKRDSSLIKFVLLEKIGKAVIDEISFNELYNYI